MSMDDVRLIRGLPEPLPAGEDILWQGEPSWAALARRTFHARKLALYFGVLLAWRAASALTSGASPLEAAIAVLWLAPLAGMAVGLVSLIPWLIGRTTVYTVTTRRVVMRVGVVLGITFNIPFHSIRSAGFRAYPDGTGDIPLRLADDERVGYFHLWPHVRPWRIARAEPMLRAVPDATRVAEILSRALAASTGGAAHAPSAVPAGTALPPTVESPPFAAAH